MKHAHVQSAYDLWARLENTEKRFPALLRKLHDCRDAATYTRAAFAPGSDDLTEQLEALRELSLAARSAVGSPKKQISVIATRDIEAGSLVGGADGALRPAKGSR